MLLVSGREVEALLDVEALIDALSDAMVDLSSGRASAPDRVGAAVADSDGLLAAMPGYVPSAGVLASKLVTLYPRNAGTDLPTHQALVAMFDPATGQPVALLDGTAITAIRTGAGSALATRLLAREDASTLAILGTGVQAHSHARAVTRVRDFEVVRVAARDHGRAVAFAEELSGELGLPVQPVASWEEACAGADVVCATTDALEPVVRREYLDPGVHVNSVGYNTAGREVDDATVADSLVVVESRSAALAPVPAGSNDLLVAIEKGLVSAADLGTEIGEVIDGRKPGRTSPEQLTLYKSVGVAVQDGVAAGLVLSAARERGAGIEVEL